MRLHGNPPARPRQTGDGHQTGIYSWDVLHELGRNQQGNWADYLAALGAAGLDRGSDRRT